jgi:hypothetical protein
LIAQKFRTRRLALHAFPMRRDVKSLKLIFYTMSAEVIHSRLVAILKTA